MKTLNPLPKFMLWAIWRALSHPRTPIEYLYCPACNLRFNPSETECPKCHDKIRNAGNKSAGDAENVGGGSSPELRQQSPVPWYGSIAVIVLGIVCWCLGAGIPIPGLDEAGRALVYVPLGNLFGLTLRS
jgi:hypothetical protein